MIRINPRRFKFKKVHIPSGRTFIEDCDFDTRALFEAALVKWNEIGKGFWKYEEAV